MEYRVPGSILSIFRIQPGELVISFRERGRETESWSEEEGMYARK